MVVVTLVNWVKHNSLLTKIIILKPLYPNKKNNVYKV